MATAWKEGARWLGTPYEDLGNRLLSEVLIQNQWGAGFRGGRLNAPSPRADRNQLARSDAGGGAVPASPAEGKGKGAKPGNGKAGKGPCDFPFRPHSNKHFISLQPCLKIPTLPPTKLRCAWHHNCVHQTAKQHQQRMPSFPKHRHAFVDPPHPP